MMAYRILAVCFLGVSLALAGPARAGVTKERDLMCLAALELSPAEGDDGGMRLIYMAYFLGRLQADDEGVRVMQMAGERAYRMSRADAGSRFLQCIEILQAGIERSKGGQ